MSEKSPDKIQLDLGASRSLAALLIVVHVGAVAIALTMPMAYALRVVFLVLVAFSLIRALRRHALRSARDAIVALELDGADDDDCAVRRQGDEWRNAQLVARWIHPWLTLLVVKCDGSRWSENVVIAADSVAAEPFRRLRVRLRWRSSAA